MIEAMKRNYWIDGEHNVHPCSTYEEFLLSCNQLGTQVDDTTIGNVRVSTVFLSVNHGSRDQTPIVFETMVFGGSDIECQRYTSWSDAVAGHCSIVEKHSN